MSDKPKVLYRYTGKGEALRNIPARDLTQVDYDRLGLIEQVATDGLDAVRLPARLEDRLELPGAGHVRNARLHQDAVLRHDLEEAAAVDDHDVRIVDDEHDVNGIAHA